MLNSILIRGAEVCKMLGISRSTLYARLDPKNERRYSAAFPRPIKEGRSTRWIHSEVLAYAEYLKQNRVQNVLDAHTNKLNDSTNKEP